MLKDANDELDKITPERRADPEVFEIRHYIHMEAKKWPMAAEIARRLTILKPNDSGWKINWAYATRRAESIEAAKKILLDAEKHHSQDAQIKFNLGCYMSQLGDLEAARAYVKKAIDLDQSFQKQALEDPDLEPIRESLKFPTEA